MTDDMSAEDDALPLVLQDAARTYNEVPGAIPREAMWAAIARARSGVVGTLPSTSAPVESGRWNVRRLATWAAAAAVLLAVGYSAGRRAPATASALLSAADDRRTASVTDAVAATQHFARAEVVLTQFRNSVSHPSADTAALTWARQLLRDTRLMLDSPAADDPMRRSLFQDLELILVQIIHSSRANNPEDLKLTSDALRDSGLLDKLRIVVPSGTAPRS